MMNSTPDTALKQSVITLEVSTQGVGFTDISTRIGAWLSDVDAFTGLCTVFLKHTSAGLVVQENADPTVQIDLATALQRAAPESADWIHNYEGADDMPAHIKSMLTGVSLQIPVIDGRLDLGTWQGVYVAEFRHLPHRRSVTLHYLGTKG